MKRWPAGALLATAAAVGLLVGLRAVAALDPDGFVSLLTVHTLPRDTYGIRWSGRATWPADAQLAAWSSLLRSVSTLVLATVAMAALNATALLAEASAERRREVAVRWALGATPWCLVRRLAAELRTLALAGGTLGLIAGASGGVAARLTWPDAGVRLPGPLPLDLLAALAVIAVVLLASQTMGVWSAAKAGRVADDLRSGDRSSADPAALFVRKTLAATHVAIAATVLLVVAALAGRATESVGEAAMAERSVSVISVGAVPAGAWSAVLEAVASVPGIEAESLAAPGTLVGLGVRDIAIAECGRCSRGGLPTPLWNALADHHVVGPGYFDLVRQSVVDGRALTRADDEGAPPVAVVNRTFANTSFEGGRPIGKRVRVGRDIDAWYTVVGIVDDDEVTTLGADGIRRAAVYLSALQRAPERASILVRGDDDAVRAARQAVDGAGGRTEPAQTLATFRTEHARAVVWSRRVAALLAVLSLLLAAHGTWVVALQTTRRRGAELAVRRALGASTRHVVTHVLLERLRVTGWGLAGFAFLGTLASAYVQRATGLGGPGPKGYTVIGLTLAAIALTASLRAAREATSVDPRRLLR